ncbi:MAG: hypothetical protein FWD23_06970 [Oscillospiraceae bacterium]|nr:hypothetical protein [Oscillospiraceae bacterium]
MEKKIIIDEQFKALLPALDAQTYALLEESLLENGCLHPLVLWNNILIDGHNRYEICQKHEIEFETIDKEFASRDEALIWIITTQVARRNLTPIQLSYYRGVHYNADKRVQGTSNLYSEQMKKRQNDVFQKSTSQRLAEQYKVSSRTIDRDAQLAAAIDAIGENSAEAKGEILSGAANITRQRLQELATGGSEDEIRSIAESIETGTYERPKRDAGEKDSSAVFQGILDGLNAVIAKIADAYSFGMEKAANAGDASELRAALRGHIDRLEDLYKQF